MPRFQSVLCLACVAALGARAARTAEAPKAPAAQSDWPQWRGPTRDGIAPAGPKLLDTWPKEGPPLLWKSDEIPSVRDGGCGSVVVADGRVFVYVNGRPPTTGKTYCPITLEVLTDWGWVADMPAELAKKIEAARVADKRKGLKPGPALDAYVNEFIATLEPSDAKKYDLCIRNRFKKDIGFFTWDELSKVSSLRDKEYKAIQELFSDVTKLADMHHRYGGVNDALDEACAKVSKFTDGVVCLDAATGKETWRKDFPDPVREKLPIDNFFRLAGASGTPAVAGGRCFVVGSSGMYCLSVTDGSVIWTVPLAAASNSSPLVLGDTVYAMLYGSLHAFEATTGKKRWHQPKANGNAALVWKTGGKTYLIAPGGVCIDPEDGKIVWQAEKAEVGNSTPVISSDTLVLFGSSKFQAFKISPQGAVHLYTQNYGPNWSERLCSPLVYQNYVYQNCDRCMDLLTGDTKWTTKELLAQFSSPILVDGKIIAHAKSQSVTYLIKPSPEKLEVLGELKEGVACCTSPAYSGGKLYLRLSNCVAAYDLTESKPYLDRVTLKDGQLIMQFKQVEGGLALKNSPDGTIKGLNLVGASGAAKPAKAQIQGSTVIVDVKDSAFPLRLTYGAEGNLCAKNGDVTACEWQSPHLEFESFAGNTLTLKFFGSSAPVDEEPWKDAAAYTIAGAKVIEAEVITARCVRLKTDKAWKEGDCVTLDYPAVSPDVSGPKKALAFTITKGQLVENRPLTNFLVGEARESLEPAKLFEADNLDKDVKPTAGEHWKLASNGGGVINFTDSVGKKTEAVAHACAYVYSQTDRKVQLWVGHAGVGMQVYVNGKPVHTNRTAFNPWPNVDQILDREKINDVELKQGWNTVLMGVGYHKEGWWLCGLRIRDEHGQAPTGLHYMADLAEPAMSDPAKK
ncbi:MAG: PQQ-binding-like beta-propeller repeat protein [Planctomycetes bacterium]|nr:PQQ-binding-like beta-propeller repeat protein [Planctomycetota bacterium]